MTTVTCAQPDKYQIGDLAMETMREYMDLVTRPLTEAKAQASLPLGGTYSIVFYNAGDDTHKTIAMADSPEKALKIIKNAFYDIHDTGDRLRRVAPNIFVMEPDYENTGERATIDNYDSMYHWIVKQAAA